MDTRVFLEGILKCLNVLSENHSVVVEEPGMFLYLPLNNIRKDLDKCLVRTQCLYSVGTQVVKFL